MSAIAQLALFLDSAIKCLVIGEDNKFEQNPDCILVIAYFVECKTVAFPTGNDTQTM